MKSLLLVSSLLLSAVSTASLFAHQSSVAPTDSLMPLPSREHARIGMSREDVLDHLGEPTERLCDSVWVYADFRARNRPESEKFSALIILFAEGKVSLIRLTDRPTAKALIAKWQTNTSKPATIAAK